eukprot:c21217_g1_i2 orf=135-572(+)
MTRLFHLNSIFVCCMLFFGSPLVYSRTFSGELSTRQSMHFIASVECYQAVSERWNYEARKSKICSTPEKQLEYQDLKHQDKHLAEQVYIMDYSQSNQPPQEIDPVPHAPILFYPPPVPPFSPIPTTLSPPSPAPSPSDRSGEGHV